MNQEVNIKELVKTHNALYEQVQAEIVANSRVSLPLLKKYRESFQRCDALIASGKLSMRF